MKAREEIIQAISDDKMMPFIQPEQLAEIVDFVIKNYKPSLPSNLDEAAEDAPKIKGWVARDIHGTLRLYGNDAADGMGIRTGELPSPYKELTAKDDPIEIELEIHRDSKIK